MIYWCIVKREIKRTNKVNIKIRKQNDTKYTKQATISVLQLIYICQGTLIMGLHFNLHVLVFRKNITKQKNMSICQRI